MRTCATVALLVMALSAGRHFAWGEQPGAPARVSSSPSGMIEGFVRVRSAAALKPTAVENTTDPDVCGRKQTLDDLVVSATARGVAHAIVALEDVPAGRVPPPSPGRLVLDNRRCRFVPHTAVLTVGSTFEALNSDPVLHTVHLYGPLEANIALPLAGMKVARRLDKPGMIVVKCDVHGWMQAFVRVDTHPFHAVSDRSGAFRIEGVPPGQYTMGIWHERLGALERRVQVKAGETARVEIDYSQ